jgi:CHAT domain-containing protein
LNENFTQEQLQAALNSTPYSVLHIASHSQFSSNDEDTFILTWDDVINILELRNFLRATNFELLFLNTDLARGDDQAPFGMARVAFYSGVPSTVSSLWAGTDEAAAFIAIRFYQELAHSGVTKAEALRRAQLAAQNNLFEAPRDWSRYVLIGDWR